MGALSSATVASGSKVVRAGRAEGTVGGAVRFRSSQGVCLTVGRVSPLAPQSGHLTLADLRYFPCSGIVKIGVRMMAFENFQHLWPFRTDPSIPCFTNDVATSRILNCQIGVIAAEQFKRLQAK
jgi:hypothetical protein